MTTVKFILILAPPVLTILLLGHLLGQRRGWKQADALIKGWRLQSADWRYAFERAVAKNAEELEHAEKYYHAQRAEILGKDAEREKPR